MKLKDKKILVTGGRGFLGKALVPLLEKKGAEVFTFSRRDYDLREKEDVQRLLDDSSPDIVIHLAVDGGGIGYMKEYPGSVFYNNTMMNTNLIEQCNFIGVDKFVGIGSVCAYPKITDVPFREKDLWKGYPEETNASYGLSKKMMMVQGQAYRQQYGFNAIHLLQINLYGPNDDFDLENSHVVPALIRRMIEAKENKDEEIVIWGTGKVSREFLYVEDCAKAIVKATESYDKPEPINIGAGAEITIKELAYKIKDLVGFKGKVVFDTTKPDGQPRRCLNVSKAEKEFGFKATTSFDEGLAKTIEWYLKSRKVIIVYGSLRKGGFNYRPWLESKGAMFLGKGKIKGFSLYDLGSFPAVIKGDGEVVGELYEVSEEMFDKIDWMEKSAGYKKQEITVNGIKCALWFFTKKTLSFYKKAKKVEHGDYIKSLGEK